MAGKKLQSAKKKKMINNMIVHMVLAVLAVIWLLPIVWVILTSFRAEKGSYVSTFFPKAFTLDNYVKLFTDTSILNFPQMFWNTFIIGVCCCVISTVFVISVAYCMSRMRFKMRKPFMNIAMILGLFPSFMSMVAVYCPASSEKAHPYCYPPVYRLLSVYRSLPPVCRLQLSRMSLLCLLRLSAHFLPVFHIH